LKEDKADKKRVLGELKKEKNNRIICKELPETV